MQQIDVTQLRARVEAWVAEGRRPQLLDVREPWEVAHVALALPGATAHTIPMQQVPARHAAELDAGQPLLVLCHHGMRSLQVTHYLARQGYPLVYNIAGGIDAWSCQVDPAAPRY